jgi:integrase
MPLHGHDPRVHGACLARTDATLPPKSVDAGVLTDLRPPEHANARIGGSAAAAAIVPAGRSVSEIARAWLERVRGRKGAWTRSTAERYQRVVRCQIDRTSDPALPRIGAILIGGLTVDDVALWSAGNERILAPTTAKLALLALAQITRFAVRRGWLASDPVRQLEPGEKPNWRPGRVAALQGDDLAQVLLHAESHRPLFEVVAFTGMRISEGLGMLWRDVDMEAGVLHVEQQLSRYRMLAPLKTESSRRDIELAPAVVRLLRERWLA